MSHEDDGDNGADGGGGACGEVPVSILIVGRC